MDKSSVAKSRFLSLILRHKPEEAGITLDGNGFGRAMPGLNPIPAERSSCGNGWANVSEIVRALAVNREQLNAIVTTNNKKRFEFSPEGERIRACQGHSGSVAVDVELTEVFEVPPLYHGTAKKWCAAIFTEGLKKMTRQHVHLSEQHATALEVGRRHGASCVFKVDGARMLQEGFKFYRSNNGVYLTEYVPSEYLSLS